MTFLLHDTANGCGQSDRQYAESKFTKLSRFLDRIDVVEFRHRSDKLNHRAEVLLRGGGNVVRVSASSTTLREAIDSAFDRAAQRLRRIHRKGLTKSRQHLGKAASG